MYTLTTDVNNQKEQYVQFEHNSIGSEFSFPCKHTKKHLKLSFTSYGHEERAIYVPCSEKEWRPLNQRKNILACVCVEHKKTRQRFTLPSGQAQQLFSRVSKSVPIVLYSYECMCLFVCVCMLVGGAFIFHRFFLERVRLIHHVRPRITQTTNYRFW